MRPYIIAEIGFNHEGDIDIAKRMIDTAADAGADAVKFQTFEAADILLPNNPNHELLKKVALNHEQHSMLFGFAKQREIEFISTPFSRNAVDMLEKIGVSAYKVASMDCVNQYLLKHIAKTEKNIFLSTGMATIDEISSTLSFLKKHKSGSVNLLHCISMYPAEANTLNLASIDMMKKIFGVPVGYSDHFPGVKACLLAAFMGAEVIETHFTLDSEREGYDHYHSADPAKLKNLILDIELFHSMRGHYGFLSNRPDMVNKNDYRRGLYTSKPIKKGESLNDYNLLGCRPATSFSPNDIPNLIGRTVNQDLPSFTAIKGEYLT